MNLELNFYGIKVKVICRNSNTIDYLKKDFHYFVSEMNSNSAQLTLEILEQPPPYHLIPRGMEASIITLYWTSYRQGKYVYIDYPGRGFLIFDLEESRGKVYSDNELFLVAILQKVIVLKVFELLSDKGIYAFPWLSLSVNGLAILFLLFPGGGKTTLALELLTTSEFKLLSDDYTLTTQKSEILPFPLNISVRGDLMSGISQDRQQFSITLIHEPRVMIDVDLFSDKLSGPSRPYVMAVCKRIFSEEPRLENQSKWKTVILISKHILTRYKLEGVSHYVIAANKISWYRRYFISAARTLAAIKILWRSQTYVFYLGVDKAKNARVISEFIRKKVKEDTKTEFS